MGRHDEAMNLLDNSKFVKCAVGTQPRVRLLSDPYVSNRQYPSSPTVKTVFSWPVWDYASNSIKILEKGKSVKDQLDTIESIHGFSEPSNYDIIITTTGTGMQTEYRVDAIERPMAPLPDKALLDNMLYRLDLAKESGGIPIGQVNARNMPKTQVIKGKAETQVEAPRPTHADVMRPDGRAGVPVDEPGDTILDPDYDSTQPVDLDSIPFDGTGEGQR